MTARRRHELTLTEISERLEILRLEKGWSYRELGERIGAALDRDPIPESTLRKVISGGGDEGYHDTTVYPLRKYVEQLEEKR